MHYIEAVWKIEQVNTLRVTLMTTIKNATYLPNAPCLLRPVITHRADTKLIISKYTNVCWNEARDWRTILRGTFHNSNKRLLIAT